jgi:hypothetical protein
VQSIVLNFVKKCVTSYKVRFCFVQSCCFVQYVLMLCTKCVAALCKGCRSFVRSIDLNFAKNIANLCELRCSLCKVCRCFVQSELLRCTKCVVALCKIWCCFVQFTLQLCIKCIAALYEVRCCFLQIVLLLCAKCVAALY